MFGIDPVILIVVALVVAAGLWYAFSGSGSGMPRFVDAWEKEHACDALRDWREQRAKDRLAREMAEASGYEVDE